jgi:prevent-host-death family protein
MPDFYSLAEAKAQLSAIVRQVREGRRVFVTVHGRPVAEIRPIEAEPGDLVARLAELESRGILTPAPRRGPMPAPIARRPGAVQRFLDEHH